MTTHADQKTTRRTVLRAGLGLGGVAAAAAVASQAQAQTKIAPALVQYQDTPKDGKRCDACIQWVAPNGCKLVDGPIKPEGWCALFAPKA